jgi:hypothetical protein
MIYNIFTIIITFSHFINILGETTVDAEGIVVET